MDQGIVVPFRRPSRTEPDAQSGDFPDPNEGIELIDHFLRIRDPKVRAAVTAMVAAIASADTVDDAS